MSRGPVIRTFSKPRRLACGHAVPAGTPVASKGRAWLCCACEPWGIARTVAQVLADAARDAEQGAGR
jgi:hypothetical protein